MKRKYTDNTTDFTEPFWDNLCPVCKKRFWSVSLDCACPKCGNYDLYVLNESKHLKHDAEELKKELRKRLETYRANGAAWIAALPLKTRMGYELFSMSPGLYAKMLQKMQETS